MCPGGVVVPTPTEPGLQCTNGMSNSHRSSAWANAGLVVAVSPADFAAEGFDGPLAGLAWQRKWERAAFELAGGGYRAPAQRLAAVAGAPTGRGTAALLVPPGGRCRPIWTCSTPRRFAPRSAPRCGPSTGGCAASSPTRRSSWASRRGPAPPAGCSAGEDLQSTGVAGLYPCGEGAGYAGGITSSAVDGVRVAEAIAAELGPA